MAQKRGRGRPPLKPADRLSDRLMVRIRPDELQAWTRAAKTCGQALRDWARDVLNRAAKRRLKK